jgi:hypothetical protein
MKSSLTSVLTVDASSIIRRSAVIARAPNRMPSFPQSNGAPGSEQRICGQLREVFGGGAEEREVPSGRRQSTRGQELPEATLRRLHCQGGREVSPDLLSANTNKVIGAHSFGNSNEKQIMLTKLGKEAWDTKAAEIGQHQSHNRRCDFMNLMHPRELLAKDVYPSVTEENTAKTIEGILLEDCTGGPKQDGPISGPSEGDLDKLSHEDEPVLEIVP